MSLHSPLGVLWFFFLNFRPFLFRACVSLRSTRTHKCTTPAEVSEPRRSRLLSRRHPSPARSPGCEFIFQKKKGRGRPIERFQLPVRNSSAEEKPPSRNQVRLISPFKTVAPTNGRGLAFGGRALIDDWQSLQMNSIHWQKSRKELEAEPRKSLRSLRNGISQAKKVTWITDHG